MDLWPDISTDTIEDNCVLDILREQARIIKEKTGGVIQSTVSIIEYSTYNKYVFQSLTPFVSALSQFSQLTGTQTEELEDELKSKQDINEILKDTIYKFEVFNDYYRFRILKLINSIDFPVEIVIDEGISDECGFDRTLEIKSNSEFSRVLQTILCSAKMRRVINRMVSVSQDVLRASEYELEIIKTIQNNPSVTTKEIANAMGWSINNTKQRLNTLKEKGVIESLSNNGNLTWSVVNKKNDTM